MKNLIRFDWALKRLLRNKANHKILEGLMSELLNEDITIINILESPALSLSNVEGNQETEDDKFNRVDLLVENSKKELTIIEIQNRSEYDYFHRILYGTSKLISEYLKLGEPYEKVRKVYSINIIYFNLGQGEDYIYHGRTDFEGMHKHDKLLLSEKQKTEFHKNEPAQIFPEYYIIKVNCFDDYAKNTLDEWIYYLKNDEIKDEFRAKGLMEAREILKVDKLSEEDRKAYKRYWENKSFEASILHTMKIDAVDIIKKDKAIEIATQMLKDGEPIEKIIKYTGLTKEELQSISPML